MSNTANASIHLLSFSIMSDFDKEATLQEIAAAQFNLQPIPIREFTNDELKGSNDILGQYP